MSRRTRTDSPAPLAIVSAVLLVVSAALQDARTAPMWLIGITIPVVLGLIAVWAYLLYRLLKATLGGSE